MEKKVKFYNPHPGLAGAIVALPMPMKKLADSLDGKVMTLEQAIEKLKPVAKELGGTVEAVKKYRYISFEFGNSIIHSYRLINYKKI